MKYYLSVCSIVRDELDLLEWIAYNKVIGVEHIYLYDNCSKIPVKDILHKYVRENYVDVFDWAGDGDVQMQSYNHFLHNFGKDSKHTAFIDADEFMVPIVKNSIPEVLADYEGFGGVNISWVIYGSNGNIKRQPNILEHYTKRMSKKHFESTHTKAIVQNQYVVSTGSNPHTFIYKLGYYSVSEDFKRVPNAWTPHCSNKFVLNHYCLKSLEDWNNKISKPRADTSKYPGKSLEDFFRFDKDCFEEDGIALRFIDSVKEEIER